MTNSPGPQKILITGAHGLIGNLVYTHLAGMPQRYAPFGMVRREAPSTRARRADFHPIPEERLRLADLTDFAAVQRAMEGMDVVVHMAADPGSPNWGSVLNNNIVGTYHVFEAARMAGVRRIIFASSNQVVFGYAREEPYTSLFHNDFAALPPEGYHPIDHTQPTWPMNYYGCSKVFGEALGHMYSAVHNISVICLRIGWVLSDDAVRSPILWCSQRDVVQLVQRSIDAPPSLRFDIFFGQSDNRHNLVDIQHARDVLGYAPQDRAEDHPISEEFHYP
jgi:nucleoside-diphosphate-sugar epimerase